MRQAALVAILLAWSVYARAECREESVLTRGVIAARIERAANFVNVYAKRAHCPSVERACQMAETVKAGEIVLIGPSERDYTCAMANIGQREVTGWLPTSRLVPLLGAVLPWEGRWERRDAVIDIAHTAGRRLRVSGLTTPSVIDPWGRVMRGSQLGELDAKVEPAEGLILFTMGTDGTLGYEDGAPGNCRVWMLRRGPYLVVRDNDRCGRGVSFSGLYRRH